MNTLADVNLLIFLLLCILAVIAYAGIGLAVLLALEHDPEVEAITNPIEGWHAWLLFALWPLTACWLAWRARASRQLRRRRV